jgi:beta-glucanase (GH16 family)
MEAYRNSVLANVCNPKPTWCGWSSTKQSVDSLGGEAWTDQFHLWAMDWNARRIRLFLDGQLLRSFATADAARGYRRSPYIEQPAFLLLSQAIGGANGGHPDSSAFPVWLEVRYVRVYQRAGEKRRRTMKQ